MNILLTSVGRRTYLIDYFKEALDGIGRVYASNSEYTHSLSHADDFVLTPMIYDENYIVFLINYCKKNGIKAIVSLFDIDLYILAKNKLEFERNEIFVVVSNENAISICNDKWNTYQFLLENEINCPKTYKSLQDIKQAVKQREVYYPIVIKPRFGMGSIGIFIAEDEMELDLFSKKINKQIFDSYLKYESSQAQDSCILYQEKINGIEYGLDVFNDFDSNLVSIVAKQKIAMRAGETDIAKTVDASEYLNIAKKISKGLRHIANLDVDIFKTENGQIYVLELNCRFGGQYPFSHLAGVNYPKQIVKWLVGERTDISLLEAKVGVTSCKDLVPVEFTC
ncbi:MAG: ATP-grasp domain-containing protein [Spirochaetaceae bacterium]|nr:ATP-grasp domain-containing protein [Spirochaetaceae bacterium]